MEDLEKIQINAKRLISGNLNVYFCIISVFLASISLKVQIFSLFAFTFLGVYAVGKKYLKIVEVPLLFLVPSILVIILTIEGESFLEFWVFRVSDKALSTASSTLLRVLAVLSILTYLISTTTLPEFISALKKLRFPKFLIDLMFLSYRSIQVLFSELKKFEISANLRLGYIDFKTSISTKSLLAKTLFVRALNRVEKTALAMDIRGDEVPEIFTKSKGFPIVFAILCVNVVLCLK